MVFIDTPLDVAMARRLRRIIGHSSRSPATEILQLVESEIRAYDTRVRPIYE